MKKNVFYPAALLLLVVGVVFSYQQAFVQVYAAQGDDNRSPVSNLGLSTNKSNVNLVPLDHTEISCTKYVAVKVFSPKPFNAGFKVFDASLSHVTPGSPVGDPDSGHEGTEMYDLTATPYNIVPPYTDVEIDIGNSTLPNSILVKIYDLSTIPGTKILKDTLLLERDCEEIPPELTDDIKFVSPLQNDVAGVEHGCKVIAGQVTDDGQGNTKAQLPTVTFAVPESLIGQTATVSVLDSNTDDVYSEPPPVVLSTELVSLSLAGNRAYKEMLTSADSFFDITYRIDIGGQSHNATCTAVKEEKLENKLSEPPPKPETIITNQVTFINPPYNDPTDEYPSCAIIANPLRVPMLTFAVPKGLISPTATATVSVLDRFSGTVYAGPSTVNLSTGLVSYNFSTVTPSYLRLMSGNIDAVPQVTGVNYLTLIYRIVIGNNTYDSVCAGYNVLRLGKALSAAPGV